ncbi:hypothetical protein NC652_020376 [Populus alba x Populus x berolinensis]|uniref:Uncharacterized protein n=1 Tax=Populus alba x Populus x berolinensis TaxID=444605 RepID=A0AAD6MKL6_9ROSI|nr:hypothetical protein NC652_020376 [Populus alba x Populus x berolinensis]KAJ6986894.1 hypothetical protein NC653_020202 [Populus alba x Populus x berolinensis]
MKICWLVYFGSTHVQRHTLRYGRSVVHD